MAWTAPTLWVAAKVSVRKARKLPLDGDVVVDRGEWVRPEDPVARATEAGHPISINLWQELDLKDPGEVARYLVKAPGDSVQVGDVIARKSGRFGTGKRDYLSPIDGVFSSGPTSWGEILLTPNPRLIELQAHLPGKIVNTMPNRGVIIEAVGACVQCVACFGGDTRGTLKTICGSPSESLEPHQLDESCDGAVLVGSSVGIESLRAALLLGVRAIIVGSITAATYRWLLDNPQPVTLLVTEGFGSMPMARHTFDILAANEGREASVLAPVHTAWGASPAEVFVPADEDVEEGNEDGVAFGKGATVRILRGELAGTWATIDEVLRASRKLGSGVQSPVVTVDAEDKKGIIIGRSNVELVG
ncbi:MAG: hypothetical protein M1343_06395 [Chloroflexi bacterium]|nr:hypothetical protein [Chloroflexota bacterium]MDA8188023.1 hypothetical protein [Dehalococcoidales bacterium]